MISNPHSIQVYLLGKFEVCRQGRTLKEKDWSRRKAVVLLQRLAYERRMTKDQAIEHLWPESDPVSGVNNLYRILHVMRQTVNQSLGEGTSGEIFSYGDGILVFKDSVWVDVHEFERLSQVVFAEALHQQHDRFTEALKLYQGDFLPAERYAEWTALPRNHLARLHREISLASARRLLEQGDFPAASGLLMALLAKDPSDELVHRELMRLYAQAGRRQEALRQYQACQEALQSELGVGPDAETRALYLQIQRGDYPPAQDKQAAGKADWPAFDKSQPLTSLSVAREAQARWSLFTGREQELGILEGYLQRSIKGEGRVVFLRGEAGQGKTSLMAEFAYRALAVHPELVAAAGTCQALTGYADPYLPFRDLISMLAGDSQARWLGEKLSPPLLKRLQSVTPKTLEILVHQAASLVDILVAGNLLPNLQEQRSKEINQLQVFEQTRKLLDSLAAQRPLLLLLDDLQWADAASANLLFYLGRQLADSPILVIGAYRPSELNAPAAWQTFSLQNKPHLLGQVVKELERQSGIPQVDLDVYSPTEGRSFVDAILDREPNRLDASFREMMYRRTKGQPLFTVELLRALQEQGLLVVDEQGMWSETQDLKWDLLPARVEAVIDRRIEQLPQELRRLLSVASIEGEYFTVEALAQVQEQGVLRLLQYLSQELDQRYRLVREVGTASIGGKTVTRYQFRHNLFQEYLYQKLSIVERRYLHGALAAVLEQMAGDDLDEVVVSLAHHFRVAGQTGKAAVYFCRAGDLARRRVALEEAAHSYQAALDLWQEKDAAVRAESLHKLGETLLALGKSQQAIERFYEADSLYSQAGNPTARGAVQRLIGRSYWEQADRASALQHYREALALLEGGPAESELARAISAIAQMEMLADSYDQAIDWGERALALALELQIEDVILHTLTTLGVSRVAKGEVERGLSMLEESRQRAQAAGYPHDTCRAYTGMGDSLVQLERYAEARGLYEQMLSYARTVGAALFEGVSLIQLGYLEWWAGRWRSAGMLRQAILDWMEADSGNSIAKVWASTFLGGMYNDLGLPEYARTVLEEYTSSARLAGEPQTTIPHLRELARSTQDEEEKAALIHEILQWVDRAPSPRYEIIPALTMTCIWMAEDSAGDIKAAEPLEKAYRKVKNRLTAASLYQVKGFAAGLRGEWGEAISFYKNSIENWEKLERPYEQILVWSGMVQSYKQSGEITMAKNAKRKAISLVKKLAAELDDPQQRNAFLNSPLVKRI
jgi:predicted ATPase/DNA-binding SARP family transcriptional activator